MRDINFNALAIAGVTLAVGLLWPSKLRRYLPATLAALVAGTLLGVLWLTDTPVIGAVPTGLPEIHIPAFSLHTLAKELQPALTIALLGSIDSLLTSLIADSMTRSRHNANRELAGQDIANTVSGFIGGLPGAGNTLSTVLNIRAGGRTPVAGVLVAAVLIGLVLGLGKYVESIPHAVLAGILIKVGWDIIDWRFLSRAHRVQREHLIVMLLTMTLTVFLDLVTAVAIGLIAAGMAAARQFELLDRTFLGVDDAGEFAARVGMLSLHGSFSVASSNRLITAISQDLEDPEVVILDFTDTVYMDDSAALAVGQLIDIAIDDKTKIIVMGLEGRIATTLRALNVLKKVPLDRFVPGLDEAMVVALEILDND